MLISPLKVHILILATSLCNRIIKLSVSVGNGTETETAQTVIVHVHKNILCRTSDFFKRATKEEWSKSRADPDTIDLANDDFEVVKAYAHWLYFQQPPAPITHCVTKFPFLAKSYVFGEKVMDITFKNVVIDLVVAEAVASNTIPASESMDILYLGTPEGSPARRLMVDFCVDAAGGKSDAWV